MARFARAFTAKPRTTWRLSSTASQPITNEEARSRAKALIDLLPGDSMFKKTGYATIGAGLASFLISKGIYIPNEETFILVSFIVVVRLLYVKLVSPTTAYLEGIIEDMRQKLSSSWRLEIAQLEETIADTEGYLDHTDATVDLWETKRENILLEAQLSELEATNAFVASVKARLDEMVRSEAERKAAERRALIDRIIKGVLAELQDPKRQQAILQTCLVDLERVKPAHY